MQRRQVLHGTALLVAGTTAGCSALDGKETSSPSDGVQSGETTAASDGTTTASDETTTASGGMATSTEPSTPTESTETGSAPDVYVSEVFANPEGPDDEAVAEEYVLVEVDKETEIDLSGHTLSYGQERRYTFPDVVDAVGPKGSVEVVSGDGSSGVDGATNPTYTLFVGSDEPLLDNDGMRLTLRDATGEVIDRVDYWSMDEGSLYVRPET